MGSPSGEKNRFGDEVQREVKINNFYIGIYQVTQKQYEGVMGYNPSNFKGANLPVENVSWYDAVEFCNRLSLKEGLKPVYSIDKINMDINNRSEIDFIRWTVNWDKNANGYRLPTEAECEYACRAGTNSPFNTGERITANNANFDARLSEKTINVGSFAPNPWGIYDMHGNVEEWCWDWYGNYSSKAQTNPTGAVYGTGRVLRGGSWSDESKCIRSAYRYYSTPSNYDDILGFRIVRQ